MTTALLWSGGKDSTLALLEARRAGHKIDYLVTVRGPKSEFRAHPLPLLAAQAESAEVEHLIMTLDEPYEVGYARVLHNLKRRRGVEYLLTGDLVRDSDSTFASYWLNVACQREGIQLRCPLGDVSRIEVMRRVARYGMNAYITAVDTLALPVSMLGMALDGPTIEQLIAKERESAGFDCCGENGEYHTIVVSCSAFHVPMPEFGEAIEQTGRVAFKPMTLFPAVWEA